MLRHIVMFRLKDMPEKADNLKKLKNAIEQLQESIPEAKSIEVGVNVNTSSAAFDLVLVSDFDDAAALDKYRVHPEHQNVLELIARVNQEIAVVDYDL